MNDFLPAGYETPDVPSNYMDFAEGQNKFRVLSSAIVGYQWWEMHGEAGRKPHRVRKLEEVPAAVRNTLDDQRKAKHFWAFTVYNYEAEAIQVLVLKQQTIMRPIEAFGNNPKWGSPKGYPAYQPRDPTQVADFRGSDGGSGRMAAISPITRGESTAAAKIVLLDQWV